MQIVRVNEATNPQVVSDAVYNLHGTLKGDVRLVFDSLTGMQDLWGGEEAVLTFYSRACPRLYELDTIAYWVMEKGAHSERLRASINQIAQVAIELSLRRGKSALTILKADKRQPDALNMPLEYWCEGLKISFEMGKARGGNIDLGSRLKQIRSRQAMSQKKLAGLVGVTPSTISQIESGTIFPSIPALYKIAQVLNVAVASFFHDREGPFDPVVFSGGGTPVLFPDLAKQELMGYRLLPPDLEKGAEPYLIDIPKGAKLPAHFFMHKGEEMGYVLHGSLELQIENRYHRAEVGDVVYLSSAFPTQWKNVGSGTARLLWIKMKK